MLPRLAPAESTRHICETAEDGRCKYEWYELGLALSELGYRVNDDGYEIDGQHHQHPAQQSPDHEAKRSIGSNQRITNVKAARRKAAGMRALALREGPEFDQVRLREPL